MKKRISLHDAAFIHKSKSIDEFDKSKLTKVEMAVLISYRHWKQIRDKIESLSEAAPGLLSGHPNALQLFSQYHRKSSNKYTEVLKKLVLYSNAVYLVRIYKIVGERFMKMEITKVPLGTKRFMSPKTTVGGLFKLMNKIVEGYETTLLPHYLHNGAYRLIDDFLKECS